MPKLSNAAAGISRRAKLLRLRAELERLRTGREGSLVDRAFLMREIERLEDEERSIH